MKSKCSFILKSSIALILTALMIFGSVSTVLAATVDMADLGANADLASTGYTERNLSSSNKFYFDNSSTKWTSVKLMVMKKNGGSWSGGPWDLTQVSGTDYWYWNGGQSWNGYTHYLFYSGTWGNATQTNDIEGELASTSWYTNCFTPSGGSSSAKWGGSFNKCVGVKNFSVTASNTNSGSGTSASPYLVNTGASITLTASATAIDTNCNVNYKFNSGSYSTTTKTNTFKASSTANTEFTKTVTVKTTRGDYSSREETKTIYFKTVQPVTNYTGITAVAKGTTDGTNYSVDLGSIQSSTTVSSSTGLSVSAPTKTGYTFSKWVASGSGTFDSATSASTTFHPAANSEIATAQYKKSYTISKNSPTGGSVTLSNTSRVAGETFTVTLSASSGYRLKSLTVGGTDVTSSVSSNKYTGTAKGTSNTIAVVASYEAIPATTIYVKKTLASTFSNIHIWSNTSDNWTGAWPGQALSGWSSTTDGKYYYKSFNQDYSTFKFILNNNSSPQTSDSAAYATGKSYYIDSATAGSAAVLTEGEPKASTITYPTGNFTIGGTKPTSAYTGETVSFTVTAADGYRIDKVQYTPAGGTATTITASSGTYSFTMPDKAVTVSVTAVKTYTVTLTAGTGFATKKYKVGSGTQQEYSTAITVDSGSNVVFDVTYTTGYEYDSTSTLDGATASNSNKTFTLSNITTNKTVTLKAKEINYTITYPTTTTGYTLGGNNPTTATYNSNVSFTVTPQTGYRIDEVKYNSTKITGSNNTYSFQMPAGNVTIAVTASKVNSVKAVTNKTSRGTVTVDKDTAAQGDTVKITVTPLAGSLKSLTATYGNGKVYEWKGGNNWQESTAGQSASAPASALMNMFANPFKSTELAATGAALDEATVAAMPDLVPVGATQTIDMEMKEDSSVTINATFDTYSADSTWYYNGYDTSGNAVSGYHGKQMTESMVSGEKFSYYHVEGRTGTDQLMTVSNGAASSGTRYVYFTASAEGGWSTDENHQYAYFYNNSGDAGNAWPGYKMTKYTTNDYGQNVYRVEIPTGSSPTGVIFNNASNAAHQTTNVTDLSKGGYYLLNTSHWDDTLQKTIHDWQSYDCTYPSAGYSTGTEYFYQNSTYNGDYTGDFNTKGFYNHYTAGKEFAKPKDLGTNTGDYYINVLYPNTTYTINGVTKKTGTNPMIIWSAEPLAGDDENVTVYAKDGAIRAETFGSTYANIADTKIYAADGTTTVGTKQNGSIANQTYETYKAAKGDTLVIKTTIGATDSSTLSNAADLKAKYYVRGFCINGEVPALLEPTNDGVYTLTYKVPEDFEGKSIEITPIYYLRDTEANPIVTYRVTGFTDELKAVGTGKPGWGDTLYTYPFYGKLGGQNNAFGAYPGQPMVYYKGQYQMQIPVKSTAWDPYEASASTVNNTTVSGVTMSNGYWDSVHKQIMGYGDNSSSADHVQTYDYGDFYKIFNEKAPVDNIVFDFKYRTKKHNLVNDKAGSSITASSLTSDYGTNGNGFELLTNFHGKNVDLFGTPLSGAAADPTQTTPIYVVSIGGVNDNISGVENIAGYYATEWRVYAPNTPTSLTSTYKKVTVGTGNTAKSSIPPEVLVLNNDDTTSFNTTTYPSADANHNVTDWKAMYTELKQYAGHPVMISYEAADAQQGQGMYYTGTGGATRNDGRWLYSKNGENITSTIRIDVSHDSGATYVENPASGETGHIDGLSAYFTNADAYQKMTYSTTIDPDKTFDFEAKTTNASYKFVGWYMEDGTKITSDNVSHTERSGSYTFVARFMEVSSGQLTLSHSVDTGEIVRVDGHDYTCNGSGSAKIGAVITDADTNEVLRTFDLSSSDITIPEKYIGNDKNYKITVTLEATADTNTAYGTSKLANTDASSVTEARFFNPKTPTTSGKTTTYTFTFNVKDDLYNGTTQRALALTYHSYFIQYKFNYQINYTFNDRNGETQQYKRIGTLTPGEANTYVKKVDSNRYLDKSFIEKMAPYESNFGQDITWNFEDYLISTGGEDGSNYEYAINAHYTATQTNLNKRNITFVLPYKHNNGVAVMTTDGIGTKDTTTNLELIAVTDEDGKITQDNRVDFNTIPVLPNNGVNGIFDEDGKKNWVAAPATITDGGSILNFQYWSVKPTDRAGENDPDVARCYFQGFNFVAYDNYIITPVYGESTVEPSEIGRNTNITYVETTRNQWNSNGTNYTKAQTSSAADLLYNDFIVAYNFDGKDIYNGDANADIAELGVVVERIQKLEIKDDGTYDTTLSRYTGIAPDENGVNAAIASTTDIALSGKNKISKHAIAASELDNKNRIQFFNGIYNSAGWVQNDEGGTPAQNYGYKNYVYRAYSYMKLKNGTVIKSAVPAYFTMYDVATADAIDM